MPFDEILSLCLKILNSFKNILTYFFPARHGQNGSPRRNDEEITNDTDKGKEEDGFLMDDPDDEDEEEDFDDEDEDDLKDDNIQVWSLTQFYSVDFGAVYILRTPFGWVGGLARGVLWCTWWEGGSTQ